MLDQIVSVDAAQLYWRLSQDGAHVIDPASRELEPAEDELLVAGFAHLRRGPYTQLIAVPPATAAEIVLRQVADRIGQWHQGAARTVESLLRLEQSRGSGSPLAEVITDLPRIPGLVENIQRTARHELLSLEIPIMAGNLCQPRLSPAADSPPPVWRTVFTTGYLSPEWQHIVDTTVRSGGEARVGPSAPIKLLIADRTRALIPLDRPGVAGVVHFRAAVVVEALIMLFETVWSLASPYRAHRNDSDTLTPFERHIVTLMCTGMKDDQLAAAVHVSVRTVRRHIASILDKLGVTTRFAAGAQAAKRGWI